MAAMGGSLDNIDSCHFPLESRLNVWVSLLFQDFSVGDTDTCHLPLQPKEFESRVNIIEKIPEMKTVTQTDHVKKLEEREEMRTVPKTRVVEEQKQVTHNVPEVKEIPRTREETRYRWVIRHLDSVGLARY
jgi:hypothetical protein